jgi:hypothetical protein
VLCGPGHLVASSKIPVEDHIMRCWASKCLLVYVSCVLTAITNFGLSLLRGCGYFGLSGVLQGGCLRRLGAVGFMRDGMTGIGVMLLVESIGSGCSFPF